MAEREQVPFKRLLSLGQEAVPRMGGELRALSEAALVELLGKRLYSLTCVDF